MFDRPTEKELILFGGYPDGIHRWGETDGIQKVPVIKRVKLTGVPEKLLIFNSSRRF